MGGSVPQGHRMNSFIRLALAANDCREQSLTASAGPKGEM